MIVVKLFGGLGNQMFQYSCGRALAERNNSELLLDLEDFSDFSISKLFKIYDYRYKIRDFELNIFNINNRKAKQEVIRRFRPIKHQLMETYRKFRKISNLDNTYSYSISYPNGEKYIYYKEKKNYLYDSFLKKLSGNIYLNGFWQNEKYFADIKRILVKEFNLTEIINHFKSPFKEKIINSNSVAIHVRRSDYLLYSRNIGMRYYNQAIELIKEKVNNPEFFIFSDDIDYCQRNFKIADKIYFISPNMKNPAFDMALMNLCKHFIIANSSYSWWAAWLSNYKNKIVIAPRKWHNTYDFIEDGIVPRNWYKL